VEKIGHAGKMLHRIGEQRRSHALVWSVGGGGRGHWGQLACSAGGIIENVVPAGRSGHATPLGARKKGGGVGDGNPNCRKSQAGSGRRTETARVRGKESGL